MNGQWRTVRPPVTSGEDKQFLRQEKEPPDYLGPIRTDVDWYASTNLRRMRASLSGPISDRKLRLFLCGLFRQNWLIVEGDENPDRPPYYMKRKMERMIREDGHRRSWDKIKATVLWVDDNPYHHPDVHMKRAIKTAERFADGSATLDDLSQAQAPLGEVRFYGDGAEYLDSWKHVAHCACCDDLSGMVAYLSDFSFDPPWDPQRWDRVMVCRAFREVMACPFTAPQEVSPAVRAWDDGSVVGMAQVIYDDFAFDRMPALADALIGAGYTDQRVIAHCRLDLTHVRGCWALDHVLGKS
jgi:hypothetical protein